MNILDFGKRRCEFDVQATVYNILKRHYPIVTGELKLKLPTGRGARFDLAVFDDTGELLFTIETKPHANSPQHSKKVHYEHLTGVPNIQISGMDEAKNVLAIIEKNMPLTRQTAKTTLK